ncbi:MAG: hypothetical protein A3C02_04695 [Candidatus Andersenbacteria bacterium RIFCSPHIGHO2_02_FULL_45_11]|uniref:Uncharacterized protein n=1 Tax=Candidatus Andersenbacteria bacterium RIFCSPHIGHO2_12_FULL_45_11 TaxID=1797281 RepID=A0A1G1X273_9BACT|nr:MAG: hypothetical protein A2805_00285 [Candidatus Andersenbacteria bacterium RIFCSPHIGHO2_01_FULL_46_36]OGY34112.1 MAG: hypothetical protein A3D99_01805 [Candidatus Andersenbacteria bacterium RIFCSPHIGHO2_12_FULL_45_11]OGY34236.1 MAG: hypothetical protein A3C02_04695 [Candidatus Andersenbacteria bacterium RIFCSPHIGHO2_02_FULL_45_11]
MMKKSTSTKRGQATRTVPGKLKNLLLYAVSPNCINLKKANLEASLPSLEVEILKLILKRCKKWKCWKPFTVQDIVPRGSHPSYFVEVRKALPFMARRGCLQMGVDPDEFRLTNAFIVLFVEGIP